jgi:hypothetical protein
MTYVTDFPSTQKAGRHSLERTDQDRSMVKPTTKGMFVLKASDVYQQT